jgi:hypothetical protein
MKNVFFEHFKSLNHLLEVTENRGTNKIFLKREDLYSQGIATTNRQKEWYETKNYNESVELIEKGYKEPLQDLKRQVLNLREQTTTRKKDFVDFVGYSAHVPNTLANIPLNMINKHQTPIKSKLKAVLIL